ncbi:MAG: hypothetical protein HQL72_15160 [Magnetococcales bacterium]|nr:hypothetical protein [Magnetococcales bacterium]
MGNEEQSAMSDQEKIRRMEEEKTLITFPDAASVEETKEWVTSSLPPGMPGELKKDIAENYVLHITTVGFLQPETYTKQYLDQRLKEMVEKGLAVKKDLPDGTKGYELLSKSR